MLVGHDVFSMKNLQFAVKCLYECFLYILVDQNIVRGDAGLTTVQGLSPCKPFGCHIYIRVLVDDARTLSAELQHDRGQMLRGCCHDRLAKIRTAGEEDDVPPLSQQGSVYISMALNNSDIFRWKGFRNHIRDGLRYIRNIWRRFQYCCTS